ncbi:hypothetical protein JD844_003961 [Phrynosoma platyrhinos]|uniref:Uncharacterized protein n=1 Tax=Phrynosoma platyrhinos TaxID=52577 RepID=A0ABQ7TM75_PHRPL|nr:hypothetical protein JD844_003961 [Phrynosoma platyrhinos]
MFISIKYGALCHLYHSCPPLIRPGLSSPEGPKVWHSPGADYYTGERGHTPSKGRLWGAGRGRYPSTSVALLAENRQFLANINCSVLLLMHYLREKVGLQRTDPIDLCEENGTLKLLFLVKFPEDSASKFLTPRGTYYICKVERGAPGTKHENGYRAFLPIYKHPPSDLLDSLRNQCDFLEKSRLRILKSQDGKKPPTMESLLSCMANQVVGKSSGKAGVALSSGLDEEGTPRKTTTTAKTRAEASRKEKHR